MNPIGANTWIWVSPPTDASLAELVPRISGWGFELAEIPVEEPGGWDPDRAAEALRAGGLGATVCAAMAPGRELVAADRETIAATQDYLRACVDAAAVVGAANAGSVGAVLAGPMYASVGRKWRVTETERAGLMRELAGNLAPVAEYAAERAVSLALEPLNRFETSLINTTGQALEVVETLDSPALGLLLDTFHMNIEERSASEAIRQAGDRLFHFHACSNDRGTPGEDQIDWPSVAGALAEIGYGGSVTIESFTAENDVIATAAAIWRPLASSQDALAEDGLAFLRGLLKET